MEMFDITTLIVILAVSLILWFLFREVNCWYWKINQGIELQREMVRLLTKLVDSKEKKASNPAVEIGSDIDIENASVNDPKVMEELLRRLGK